MARFLLPLRNFVILLLWGGGVLALAGSGRLPYFLHPTLQPFTVAGGVVLILLSGFSLAEIFSSRRSGHHCGCSGHDHNHEEHDHHDEEHHHEGCCAGHGHDHDKKRNACCQHGEHGLPSEEGHEHHHQGAGGFSLKFLILLIPVLFAIFSGKAGFTATTVWNRGVVQNLSALPAAKASAPADEAADASGGNSSGGPMPLQVIDMLYALQMPSYRGEFEGKEVEMTVQYVPMTTGNPKGNRFQGVRMFITCCAADAKPLGVTVEASSIPKVDEMAWLKITGKPTFPMEGGKRTAVLQAEKVEICDPPMDPFLY